MKKKRTLLLAVLFLLAFTLPVLAAKNKTIKKGQKTMTLGTGTQVSMKVKGVGKVKWITKKTSVYQLNAKGLLKTRGIGTDVIRYKIGSKKYAIKLTVKKKGSTDASSSSGKSSSSRSSGSRSSGKRSSDDDDDDDSDTVYITATGSKYHSIPNCGNSRTSTPISRSEAISQGYGQCSRCF